MPEQVELVVGATVFLVVVAEKLADIYQSACNKYNAVLKSARIREIIIWRAR